MVKRGGRMAVHSDNDLIAKISPQQNIQKEKYIETIPVKTLTREEKLMKQTGMTKEQFEKVMESVHNKFKKKEEEEEALKKQQEEAHDNILIKAQVEEEKHINKILNELYYKEHNYDGIDELFRKAKLKNKNIEKTDVSNWLKKQATYQKTLPQKQIGKVELLPIYSEDPYSFQMDLTFFPKYKNTNDGNYVLFTAIQINTRFSYAYYGKNKEAETVLDMLNKFLENALMINSITSDEGKEFTNGYATEWFNKHHIKTYFWKKDSHKLGIINRFHRTLKSKILKYMLSTDSTRWIDVMDKLIDNLNNTFNRGIGMTPMEASNPLLTSQIINDAINKTVKIHREEPSFEVGDFVRVLKKKQIFGKQDTNYSDDVLKITKVYKNTVSLVNMGGDKEEYDNVKKKWLLKITAPYIKVEEGTQGNKKAVEENHRITQKVKKSGVERNDDQSELVSAVKGRERKKNQKYL